MGEVIVTLAYWRLKPPQQDPNKGLHYKDRILTLARVEGTNSDKIVSLLEAKTTRIKPIQNYPLMVGYKPFQQIRLAWKWLTRRNTLVY